MTAPHTADLNTALAEALNHANPFHADEVDINVTGRRIDGTVAEFRVTAWRDGAFWVGRGMPFTSALDSAMADLRAAFGGAA